jgi:hypothetical protein
MSFLYGRTDDEVHDLMQVMADRIEELEAKLAKAVGGLNSIAANTCCNKCQEAALVARTTLAELKGETDE